DSDTDSDSDYKYKSHKHHSKKKAKKHIKAKGKHRTQDAEEKDESSQTRNGSLAPPKDGEVEDIIRRLQNMSLNDPAYAALYYRAFKLDKDIVHIIRAPRDTVTSSYPKPTPPSFATGANASPITCYGCGEQGHHMNNCPKISDLVIKGVLKRDGNNRLVLADGSMLQRQRDETIVHAVQRVTGQSNYVTLSAHIVEVHTDSDTDSDSPNLIFPAKRVPKRTKEARKVKFDGVLVPPKPAWAKSKDADKPQPSGSGQKPTPNPPVVPREIPNQPTFDPDKDDDIMMEDTRPNKTREAKSTTEKPAKRTPMRSDVAKHVQPLNILDRILNTPLTMSVGEVIGTSKEVSQHLQDVIRAKRAVAQPQQEGINHAEFLSAAVIYTKSRRPLIHLTVQCDGNPIDAIVDTGSMMNIVSRRVWKESIPRPYDKSEQPGMVAANNSEGRLSGIIKNVELTCGAARTWANLYVGDNVPFDLLLGRPWQRDNHISIDERPDGTYLLFRNPFMDLPELELLVEP
ncbi:hypothetical protein L227DRAFT_484715, partial [Lentinus tigrinus ALCF2SS1-6]